jgi:hypothetical protein
MQLLDNASAAEPREHNSTAQHKTLMFLPRNLVRNPTRWSERIRKVAES